MADIPPTRASLLVRLRDAQDEQAWNDFVRLYAPAVYRLARRKGLQDADAADVTQDVLRGVAGAIGRLDYDERRGLFRSWLFTLAHRRLIDFLARRGRQEQTGGEELLHEQPSRADAEEWERDVERQLFAEAAERVRPTVSATTWQAFWQTAVEGKSGKDVAQALGITAAAVYLAKGRVMVRLKEQVALLSGENSPA